MKKETIKILFDLFYTIFLVVVLSIVWWTVYQPKRNTIYQILNNTVMDQKDLKAEGLDSVTVSKEEQEKTIKIKNTGKEESKYTICFMVDNPTTSQSTNKNNYISYQVIDEFGTLSDIHALALDGGIITSHIKSGEEKEYKVILWSEEELSGTFSFIKNPVV